MEIRYNEIIDKIPGKEYVLGNMGLQPVVATSAAVSRAAVIKDTYNIAGFASDKNGVSLPCALSVASFGVPLILRIHGEMEQEAEPFFRARLYRAIELLSVRDLVFDLSYCHYIDSSGLALFVNLYHHLGSLGGRIRFANLYPRMQRTFEMTGLNSIFAIVE